MLTREFADIGILTSFFSIDGGWSLGSLVRMMLR